MLFACAAVARVGILSVLVVSRAPLVEPAAIKVNVNGFTQIEGLHWILFDVRNSTGTRPQRSGVQAQSVTPDNVQVCNHTDTLLSHKSSACPISFETVPMLIS